MKQLALEVDNLGLRRIDALQSAAAILILLVGIKISEAAGELTGRHLANAPARRYPDLVRNALSALLRILDARGKRRRG